MLPFALPRFASAVWRAWLWALCFPGWRPHLLSSSSPAARGRGVSQSAAGPPSASELRSGSRTDAEPWPCPPRPLRSHGLLPAHSQRSPGCLAPRRGWSCRTGTCLPWSQQQRCPYLKLCLCWCFAKLQKTKSLLCQKDGQWGIGIMRALFLVKTLEAHGMDAEAKKWSVEHLKSKLSDSFTCRREKKQNKYKSTARISCVTFWPEKSACRLIAKTKMQRVVRMDCTHVICEETFSHQFKKKTTTVKGSWNNRDSTGRHYSRLDHKQTVLNRTTRCHRVLPCVGSGWFLGQSPFYWLLWNSQQSPGQRLRTVSFQTGCFPNLHHNSCNKCWDFMSVLLGGTAWSIQENSQYF